MSKFIYFGKDFIDIVRETIVEAPDFNPDQWCEEDARILTLAAKRIREEHIKRLGRDKMIHKCGHCYTEFDDEIFIIDEFKFCPICGEVWKKHCCKQCDVHYDVDEVVRVYGNTLWKYKYCSAPCYTESVCSLHKKL